MEIKMEVLKMVRCEICGKALKVYDETVQIRQGITDPKDEFLPEVELLILHAECYQEMIETARAEGL